MSFRKRGFLVLYLSLVGILATPYLGSGRPVEQSGTVGTNRWPIGPVGLLARYSCKAAATLPASAVKDLSIALGPVETVNAQNRQWLFLEATKADGGRLRVWLLGAEYPPETLPAAKHSIARYLLQEGETRPFEFRDRFSGGPVLPALGAWRFLLPHNASTNTGGSSEVFSETVSYLGLQYRREALEQSATVALPSDPRLLNLLPDLLIGLPSAARQQDETRRYDGSDYKYLPFSADDYREMVDAGINCVRVDGSHIGWVSELDTFYWGPQPAELPYPECLYRSTYLGPELFLDEPAVGTRDFVIRPRLAKEEQFRESITPQIVFDAFRERFLNAWSNGPARSLITGLASRKDIALGDLDFLQANLFSWDSVESSAAYQLSQDPRVPAAMVFEPPGRIGSRRTIPELDMTYGCQLACNDPANFTDIVYGFLRGAARLTHKGWGMSIYGAVDPADAPWFLSHAYDLGATRFFFWDNWQLACVPYHECLNLARQLRLHAANYPSRDLDRLRQAAEVAILLPAGYNFGHVQFGKGSLWGLSELNLERTNRFGVKYRQVMANFLTEIERCRRLGVAFDLFWDLPELRLGDYREAVRVREDGKVVVAQGGRESVLDEARQPSRLAGLPPELQVTLSEDRGPAPLRLTARAAVRETSAPVFYTQGADRNGVYHNAVVAWELYGPTEADYRFLQAEGLRPHVTAVPGGYQTEINLVLPRPGNYRLRAATVDLAGRSTVRWATLTAGN